MSSMHHASRLNGTAAPVVGGKKDLNTNHFPILDPNCLLFSRSVVSNPFATPWTLAHQAPLSMGFPRQEYWSELPFPSPGDLPDPGIEPESSALTGRFFTGELRGKRCTLTYSVSKRKASSTSILGEGKQVLRIYQKAFTNLWQKQLLNYSFSLLGLQYIPC